LNDLLSEEYYNEKDGTALKPEDEVVDAESLSCPTFDEVVTSPERLLTYILTRSHIHKNEVFATWYIHKDLVSAMQRHSPDALRSVFSQRLTVVRNTDSIRAIFHLIGLTLGTKGAALVRDNWERFVSTHAFSGLAFAASRCLPLEEGHAKVTDILSRMDCRDRYINKGLLTFFETQLNLDWLEENAHSPVDISWGSLAASSQFDWERAKKWLSLGRPLSLVALDALHLCACSSRKPPLLNPPSSTEFISTLEDYLSKDNVPRVREQVSTLLKFRESLVGPSPTSQ
jgi:hypothetical protein